MGGGGGEDKNTILPQYITLFLFIHRIAEIVEEENNNYLKTDPDPFDERHPTRVNPLCTLGQLFKIICKKDTFMDKVGNLSGLIE